jgi:hypothetical protein
LQTVPHDPQFVASPRFASQPLDAISSQSAKPGRHAIPQVIATQLAVARVAPAHTVPHDPQFDGSFARSTSQPLDAL